MTKEGKFYTRIGNVRVKYCEIPQDSSVLDIQISSSPEGQDEDGDDNGANADLQFPKGSDFKISIKDEVGGSTLKRTTDNYKSDFTNCENCNFEIIGGMQDFLFISQYTLPTPPSNFK